MIALISDVHGNLPALQAVLDEIDKAEVSQVLCLGDTAGYYSQVDECCNLLRERNIFSLLGNHDWYLSTGETCPRSNSANLCLDYQAKVISEENLAWLRALKSSATVANLRLVHGGWNDPLDEYFQPSPAKLADLDGNYFASGHSHVPLIFKQDDKIYCNPGSVGQPRDGDPRASYALFDGAEFAIHRIAYDIEATQEAMRQAGFDSYFYTNLANGTRIGGGVSRYL